jgi:hypothetical protein
MQSEKAIDGEEEGRQRQGKERGSSQVLFIGERSRWIRIARRNSGLETHDDVGQCLEVEKAT